MTATSQAPKTIACEVCGEPKAYETLGICIDCFKGWHRGRIVLTDDHKRRILFRMDAVLGDGGELEREALEREDDAAESRAQALYQQR